jgi:hypothetical protein
LLYDFWIDFFRILEKICASFLNFFYAGGRWGGVAKPNLKIAAQIKHPKVVIFNLLF